MKNLKTLISTLLLVTLLMPTININGAEMASIDIVVDGEMLQLDVKPTIINGRTLVPLRGVFEALNATVDWNKETRQAIIKNNQIEVLMSPDVSAALLNGRIHTLDTASTIINDNMLIPIRFVAESLGHDVDWDPLNRDVLITTRETPPLPMETGLPVVGTKEALIELLGYNNDLHNYVNRRFSTMLDVIMEAPEVDEGLTTDDLRSDDASQTSAVESEKSYSGTNNQVEGVDEGDIVKTNGDLIATISNGQVNLIGTNPTAPTLLGIIPINSGRGAVSNLYLTGNQLVVIGSSYVYYGLPELMTLDTKLIAPPTYYTPNTFTLVYDISSPSEPILTMDMDYEGAYVSSRLVNDRLYMVTDKGLDYWSINDLTDYELQPKFADNLTGKTTVIDYENLHYFPEYVAPSVMMTISINLDEGTSNVDAYLGRAETVYATSETMYLAFTHYGYAEQLNTLIYVPNYSKTTAIYKFSLNDGNITYENKGSVPGILVNQFSMDDYNNHLRIATTTGDMWNENNLSKNNLYILDNELKQVGEVTGLAPGERIYSTRFYQDRVYMVTYRQVDPFFVIDASTPTAPKVIGALKIPGFSTYMHILDANHVLGFGTDTNEENGNIRTGGIKLSLFDVTDPANPIESKKEVIGVAGTYSELQNNHKALMISLQKGLMGFPITVAGQTPYVTDFSGAYVYDITTDNFTYKGQVTHKTATNNYYNYQESIKRLLTIGDYLYSLSDSKMVVSDLEDLSTTGELKLQNINQYDIPTLEPAK